MCGRLGSKAMVLAIAMLAGCETRAIPNARGSRLLTGIEMDQITVGSAGAINGAEAHALGSVSEATAVTSSLVASGGSTVAGAHFSNAPTSNYVSSRVTASASNGQNAEASGSSHIFADGKNGGAEIDATATAAGRGRSLAQVGMHFSGISTSRADLVFGSVTAIACCSPLAEAQIQVIGRAGGPYSRELRSTPPSDTPGQIQSRVDILVASSVLPMIDPGQLLGLLTPHVSPVY